jgi:quercetin dioxygenase-like cupin family protein
MYRYLTIAAPVLLVMLLGAVPASQDPVKLAPDNYTVLLDNEHVRVVEVRLAPGARVPMHSHPPYIVYSFKEATVRFTDPDGRSVEHTLKPGMTEWADAESHSVENIGDADAHVLNVELKQHPHMAHAGADGQPMKAAIHREHVLLPADEMRWQPGPAALPPGARMSILSGDPAAAGPFAMRIRIPAGYRIPPHTHPADENVTVLSGRLHIGQGARFDPASATELSAGSYMLMPPGTQHFAFTEEPTIIQLQGVGPWDVIYVNPEDDPRRAQP